MMETILYKLQSALMKGLYAVLRILPMAWSSALARVVGWTFPYLPARHRVLNNLRLTGFQPDVPTATFLRQVGMHCCHLFFDYAHIERYAKQPHRWPIVQGAPVLERVRETGAVFVTAHIANWEMIRFAARAQGVEIAMIYRPFNNPYVDSFAFDLASEAGQPVFRKGPKGLKEMIKHIRAGRSVLILVDQRSGGAPHLSFMGQPAETSLAAAELAVRFDKPLVPCYARRTAKMTQFGVHIEDPVAPQTPLNMMQTVNNRIEHWIRQSPQQWFWVHNRWKKR